MKKYLLLLFSFTFSTVTDIDGNIYQIIQIGDQLWMAENLKVTHYNNGDAINYIPNEEQWGSMDKGQYGVYDDDPTNANVYGNLYNWAVIGDSRGVCPEGWHVPSNDEYTVLTNFLGGESVAGGKMKETGLEHWNYFSDQISLEATNESGFTGLPAGHRNTNSGDYIYIGNYGYFWSSTETSSDLAWRQYLFDYSSGIGHDTFGKPNGFSIRCVMDAFTLENYEIEGRWHLVGYEDNVMYQFVDNYRYSIYSTDGNFGDLEDAGGSPNPYTVVEDMITIDLFFGTIVTYQMNYLCDGQVVEFLDNSIVHSTLFREGYNYIDNECENDLEGNCCEAVEYANNSCEGTGCYIPQCTTNCEWEPMQCWGSIGYCWCVDENGVEIEDTNMPSWEGFPDCEEYFEECYELIDIDFGPCTMVLGIGLLNDECNYISGCDWTVDGVDYSEFFFESIEECEYNCDLDNECHLTTEDILGPYYFEDAPFRNIIAHEDEPGERLFISGTVKQNDCESSISGSLIEIWQANDEGCYGIIEDCDSGNPEDDYFNLRGKFFSDENGNYTLESILPGYYGSRPRHIHIKITTPNQEVLVSQLYFEDDPFCENDLWCQDADDRIISLVEDEFGLNGEMDLIMNSSENGIMLGDLNFDTVFNVQDIVLLVGIILDNFASNDFQVYAGNLNNDNNIDVVDIVQLINIILNASTLPQECYIIPEVGPCDGICPTYYYNQTSNECQEFITGCCGIEAFNTMQECQNICE